MEIFRKNNKLLRINLCKYLKTVIKLNYSRSFVKFIDIRDTLKYMTDKIL